MEETKQKLEKLFGGAKTYFASIKAIIVNDISSVDNLDMMNIRGMCRVLLKTHIVINDTIRQFPEFATLEINSFLEEFKTFNEKIETNFYKRIGDIDSPDLDEIVEEYKTSIKFLENWLENVYNPTVDLFTSMNPNKIQNYTIELTFNQIGKYWHMKDILIGLCDDLHIYRTRLKNVGEKLDYLYSIVNTARLNKA